MIEKEEIVIAFAEMNVSGSGKNGVRFVYLQNAWEEVQERVIENDVL